jgi:cation diffusion facilitator CzcD-associated flavoprotein CzcO
MPPERMARPRIVIIGCGFAGLWAAQALRKADADGQTMPDRNLERQPIE